MKLNSVILKYCNVKNSGGPSSNFWLVLPSLLVPFRLCCFGAAFPSWVVRPSPFSSPVRPLWVVLLSAPPAFGWCWLRSSSFWVVLPSPPSLGSSCFFPLLLLSGAVFRFPLLLGGAASTLRPPSSLLPPHTQKTQHPKNAAPLKRSSTTQKKE